MFIIPLCRQGITLSELKLHGENVLQRMREYIVGHPQAYQLRRHGSNMIGIWCHAVEFAKAEGLHGLFSGMIISEMSEAEENGIATTQDESRSANRTMFCQLRKLIEEDTPWHEIPTRMKEMDNEHTTLSEFNYNNFYYL